MNAIRCLTKAAALFMLALSTSAGHASPVFYAFQWTGVGGYSMTGNFSFDTSAGTEVRDAEVQSLSIDVLLNNVSFGTWVLTNAANPDFNFNFNAASGQFFVGGNSTGDDGQRWNYSGCSEAGFVGFGSGSLAQAVCTSPGGDPQLGFQTDLTTLQATLITVAVPEPTSGALVGLALAALAFARKRRG